MIRIERMLWQMSISSFRRSDFPNNNNNNNNMSYLSDVNDRKLILKNDDILFFSFSVSLSISFS
jgi:hypothetical protein